MWQRWTTQCTFYPKKSRTDYGIEQNVVTLCPDCHHDYDNGFFRDEIENCIRQYLKSKYGEIWNEQDLVYNKWKNFKFNK